MVKQVEIVSMYQWYDVSFSRRQMSCQNGKKSGLRREESMRSGLDKMNLWHTKLFGVYVDMVDCFAF